MSLDPKTPDSEYPVNDSLELNDDPEPLGGTCDFILDGNVYVIQENNCLPGYHAPDAPDADSSSPMTHRMPCEKDDVSGPLS